MTTCGNGESVLDVLARMKGELAFDVNEMIQTGDVTPTKNQEVSRQAPSSKANANSAQATEQPSQTPSPASERSPEESVEELGDYMGNLLNRYGQGSASMVPNAAAATSQPIISSLPQRKTKPAPPDKADAAATSTGEQGAEHEDDQSTALMEKFSLLEQHDFVPRKRAPEEKACIDAMRELSVHSARKAIQVFDNKRRGLDAKHRLALGFVAFAVAGVAFFFADTAFSLLGALGMCGVATGCMFFVNWQQTITLLKKSNNS